MIDFDNLNEQAHDSSSVRIKILGIGGAGCNTVNSMMDSLDVEGVSFVVANSDLQSLRQSKANNKVQLGVKTTKGLGCGANPEIGRRSTEEDLDRILEHIGDADIVFIVAGMGGGTGSGGAPVVAKALKDRGILSIAIVTKPFSFEGKRRMMVAEQALETLKKEVDTLIVVPNEKLLSLVDRSVSMIAAFEMINKLLIHSVKSISSIISRSGHINVDFADLRTIMKGMGLAMMGTGSASGVNRAVEAAKKAISSELLENMDIKSARGVLLNVCGGLDLSLHEINDAANVIYDASNASAHVIVGSVIDPEMDDEVIVSVVATGFAPIGHVQPEKVAAAVAQPSVASQKSEEKRFYTEESQLAKVMAEKADIQPVDALDVPAYLRKQEFSDQPGE
ncbi:cell division protein FtsZ [candidate division TM6 bacterium RIFCSPHIGHO2_12_FULL_38_8]|nr:MAG: cell division protein FtsZ [candidate division TM6 bacterium RIFCSPHIGHO2_12_FULL_38_8]